ncbi:hypothetical protein [Aliamphritea hakodatensis]|uniref:hypothetical protein n=1 Tax=Aliamphritea hakodatensis TaxID=2895352 RepID=UPI0022FD7D16|nr:hypothetical protein [Aliamphritea hakodatensis]
MTLDQFKTQFPIGTPVKYFPVLGRDRHRDTEITSDPWMVCGSGVVKVAGQTGAVSIDHIQRAE